MTPSVRARCIALACSQCAAVTLALLVPAVPGGLPAALPTLPALPPCLLATTEEACKLACDSANRWIDNIDTLRVGWG